jgi:hypothetical protein
MLYVGRQSNDLKGYRELLFNALPGATHRLATAGLVTYMHEAGKKSMRSRERERWVCESTGRMYQRSRIPPPGDPVVLHPG